MCGWGSRGGFALLPVPASRSPDPSIANAQHTPPSHTASAYSTPSNQSLTNALTMEPSSDQCANCSHGGCGHLEILSSTRPTTDGRTAAIALDLPVEHLHENFLCLGALTF